MCLAGAILERSDTAASSQSREDVGSQGICIRPSVYLWAGNKLRHLTREMSLRLGFGACDLSPLTCYL